MLTNNKMEEIAREIIDLRSRVKKLEKEKKNWILYNREEKKRTV